MLAYGLQVDATNKNVKIGKSIIIESMKWFYRAIVEIFVERYLRSPNATDITRLLHISEQRSLDCMHYKWKNPQCTEEVPQWGDTSVALRRCLNTKEAPQYRGGASMTGIGKKWA